MWGLLSAKSMYASGPKENIIRITPAILLYVGAHGYGSPQDWCAVASTIPLVPRVRAMPCYFIDTDDGRLHVIDDEGHDLADPTAARDLAHEALSDMARDGLTGAERRGFSARVRTEDGSTIYTASLTLDGEWWIEQPIT